MPYTTTIIDLPLYHTEFTHLIAHFAMNTDEVSIYPNTAHKRMPTHKNLLTIFQRVISREDAVVAAINNYGESLRLSAVGWQFTLPDLYGFCCQLDEEITELEYRQFRQYLYQHPINQEISASGNQFVIIQNRGHIDRNVYALVGGVSIG